MLIIVGYKKRVGKDEFYKTVKERFPSMDVHRVAFADSLKEEVYERLLKQDNHDISVLDNPDTKSIFRPFMQWYGTEYRRNVKLGGDPNYWIKKAELKIQNIQKMSPNSIIVVCDGRFSNEIECIKKLGGISVKISRSSVFDPNEQHPSEIALDSYEDFDYYLQNEGTLEEYKDKVESLVMALLAPNI